MTHKEFCDWLTGYLECAKLAPVLTEHMEAIQAKLKTVAEPLKMPVIREAERTFNSTQFPPPLPYTITPLNTGVPTATPPFEVTCNAPVTHCIN